MPAVDMEITVMYRILDLVGVVLNGIMGGIIARQRGFDIVGFLFLALFSALGGGLLRDTLIQQGPPAAIVNGEYLPLAFGGALLAWVLHFRGKAWELFQAHADAIVMGTWAVTGCVKALSAGLPYLSCVFMGVITAVGGGMIRDVVIGRPPTIFGGGPLYAIPALLSAVAMVVFHAVGWQTSGMIIAPLLGIALAVTSYWRGWVIPTDPGRIFPRRRR